MLSAKNLDDAAYAGLSSRCTLVIVENQAIRNLIVGGLESANRDYFGFFYLTSKLPNAREMSARVIA